MLHLLERLARVVDKLLPPDNVTVTRGSLDPMLLYGDMPTERRCLVIASIFACLFHLILFLVVDFPVHRTIFEPAKQVLVLARLVDPRPALAGGHPRSGSSPKSAPRPASVFVPIPDPTPADPEPIRRPEVTLTLPTIRLTGEDLTVGEIGPPSDQPGQNGNGLSDQPGADTGTSPGGTGDALSGPDVRAPILISHRLPRYTDQAIKAHVEGVVFLQVVIRKNGKADTFHVVRGLGYGLEERAIEEITKTWSFRPASRNGVPIDYPTLIEVTFSLR